MGMEMMAKWVRLVAYESEEAHRAFSLSSAVRYRVDVADNLGAGNRDNLGWAPGMEQQEK
jgi:hypothetical protein